MTAPSITTLRQLIMESRDGEWGQSDTFQNSVEMAVIRGTDFEQVRLGSLDSVPVRHVSRHIAERKMLRSYDIVIETAGGTKGRSTGRTLLIKPSTIARSGLPLTCASFSRFVRVNPNKADPAYVFWVLQYLHSSGHMMQYNTQHTGVSRFQFTIFAESEPLMCPPLPNQHKIATILCAYDDLIENNTRRIKILEEMAQAIYREWFVHFRFPGHEKAKMIDSQQGRVPEGWLAAKLGDVAEEVRRSVHPSRVDPDTPYFGLEHLPRKSIALSEWGVAGKLQSTKLAFEKGEILFGKIRPYFHKVGVAPVRGICSSDTIVIRPKEPQFFGFVLACVSSEAFVDHAAKTSQGTKMPRANWEVLVKYPLLIPPVPLLLPFNEQMRQSVDLMHNLIFCNRNLRQTRDLLLPRLISGEVDVSELEIDEGNAVT